MGPTSPALQAFLAIEQKGFVKGRQGTDHIINITTEYYSHLSSKQQYYVLFMDTAKAFDSIDHSFIHKILKHIGFPTWVRNVVRQLLHGVVNRIADYPLTTPPPEIWTTPS